MPLNIDDFEFQNLFHDQKEWLDNEIEQVKKEKARLTLPGILRGTAGDETRRRAALTLHQNALEGMKADLLREEIRFTQEMTDTLAAHGDINNVPNYGGITGDLSDLDNAPQNTLAATIKSLQTQVNQLDTAVQAAHAAYSTEATAATTAEQLITAIATAQTHPDVPIENALLDGLNQNYEPHNWGATKTEYRRLLTATTTGTQQAQTQAKIDLKTCLDNMGKELTQTHRTRTVTELYPLELELSRATVAFNMQDTQLKKLENDAENITNLKEFKEARKKREQNLAKKKSQEKEKKKDSERYSFWSKIALGSALIFALTAILTTVYGGIPAVAAGAFIFPILAMGLGLVAIALFLVRENINGRFKGGTKGLMATLGIGLGLGIAVGFLTIGFGAPIGAVIGLSIALAVIVGKYLIIDRPWKTNPFLRKYRAWIVAGVLGLLIVGALLSLAITFFPAAIGLTFGLTTVAAGTAGAVTLGVVAGVILPTATALGVYYYKKWGGVGVMHSAKSPVGKTLNLLTSTYIVAPDGIYFIEMEKMGQPITKAQLQFKAGTTEFDRVKGILGVTSETITNQDFRKLNSEELENLKVEHDPSASTSDEELFDEPSSTGTTLTALGGKGAHRTGLSSWEDVDEATDVNAPPSSPSAGRQGWQQNRGGYAPGQYSPAEDAHGL